MGSSLLQLSSLQLFRLKKAKLALLKLESAVLECQEAGIPAAALNLYPDTGKHTHAIALGNIFLCKLCARLKLGKTPNDEICEECRPKVKGAI